jgi:hypothetical protein
MLANHGEHRFAVKHERHGEYGAIGRYLANPELSLWQL